MILMSDKKQTKAKAASAVLELNDQGNYTVPNNSLYPHQWLWDSCFIAIGRRHLDIDRAQQEILSIFQSQWANGMVPSIILRSRRSEDQPKTDQHERIWRSWLNPNSPDGVATSGITQPPMLAEAITKIGEKLSVTERRIWYRKVFKGLLAYHSWLYTERDPHQEGLVLLIHPWEAGLDNSPAWMSELASHLLPYWVRVVKRLHLDILFGLFRTDEKFAKRHQRMTNIEALALYDVQRRLRRKAYDFNRVIDHALFAIEDLTFNCILIRANMLLREIARFIDEPLPATLLKSMNRAEKEIEKLWDEYSQEYFSRDFVSHRLIKESTIAAFMPLYSGVISKERATRIVEALENAHSYKTDYPVPSTPISSAWFQPNRYWQGPTWVNTNWLIIEGLSRYGFHSQANELKESTLKMIEKTSFFEYFNPLDGTGEGTDNFSWTAALYLDLLKA